MKKTLILLSGLALASGLLLLWSGCNDGPDDAVDVYQVQIIVLENNTSTRVGGAAITIDDNADLSCETPEGADGGSCTFMLMKGEHRIHIFKTGYRAVDSTFLVSGDMTKAYSLFNF